MDGGRPNESLINEEAAQRILEQAFELWIDPEVQRRRELGVLPEQFELIAAQQLQWPDGRVTVRLNDEVQGKGMLRAPREVQAGEVLYRSDLDHLEAFDLHDDELDCGHWTVLRGEKGWFIGFNFLSHRARCADLLSKARQFLLAAREAFARAQAPVVVDTLFSACELVSKAELVASRQIKMDSSGHGSISSKINLWRKHGNVDAAFVDLFNSMGRLRSRYRYDAQVSDPMPISDDDLELVEAMIDLGLKGIGRAPA